MKKYLLILAVLLGYFSQAQQVVYGKYKFVDSLTFSKYKNNLTLDSVLSTDHEGKLRLVNLSSSNPTWQQTLITGNSLTQNNTIQGNDNQLTFNRMLAFSIKFPIGSNFNLIDSVSNYPTFIHLPNDGTYSHTYFTNPYLSYPRTGTTGFEVQTSINDNVITVYDTLGSGKASYYGSLSTDNTDTFATRRWVKRNGSVAGWDDMLSVNQKQSTDRYVNLNGYTCEFDSGVLAAMSLQGAGHELFFSDANLSYVQLGNNLDNTILSTDINAGNINVRTVNGFGNISDGTWQINNDGTGFIGGVSYPAGIFISNFKGGAVGIGDINSIGNNSFVGASNGNTGSNDGNVTANANIITLEGNLYNTYLNLDDNAQTQTFNANNGFNFTGGNVDFQNDAIGNINDGTWGINSDGSVFFGNDFGIETGYINGGIIKFGDFNNVNTYTTIDNGNQTQTFNANNGYTFTGGSFESDNSNYVNIQNVVSGLTSLMQLNNDGSGNFQTVNDLGLYSKTGSAFLQNGNYSNGYAANGDGSCTINSANGQPVSINGNLVVGNNSLNQDNTGSLGVYFTWDASGQFNFPNVSILQNGHISGSWGDIYETGNAVFNSDLSLMGDNAGIFSDGRVVGYNVNQGYYTLYTDGNGLFYIQDAGRGVNTFNLDGNGGLNLTDRINNNTTLYTSGVGDFYLFDKVTSNETFHVDQYGVQTVDALGGFGTMSPQWLLSTFTVGSPTNTTLGFITVSINGVNTQIPAYQ